MNAPRITLDHWQSAAPARQPPPPPTLAQRFATVRAQSLALAEPLSEADCQAQSMADASPVKWHLAHVTWFFETLVLERFEPGFVAHHPAYRVLFNSYYNGIGAQHPRAQRGLLTRPSLAEVLAYRRAVDERLLALLQQPPPSADAALLAQTVELGLQHEQQHQELLLTDVLHLLSCNPLAPAYQAPWPEHPAAPLALAWLAQPGGLVEIGQHGEAGFCFDNESPRHRVWLRPHALANRLSTNAEWLDFMADGGYQQPAWWLAAGWDWVRTNQVQAPLYWQRAGAADSWHSFGLQGLAPLRPQAPVSHISLYEADAFARWSAARLGLPLRLPTEMEWEHAAAPLAAAGIAAGNFADSRQLQPLPVVPPADGQLPLLQLFGDLWEWTSSSYLAYPGYQPWAGAVAEYNGKFMLNQSVLRGGSCATPRAHIRPSYRNFFPAEARWQFNGLRLAQDL